MEALSETFLVFGRASAGAAVGLAIGWPTQGERHSRYVVGVVIAGYILGTALMWPHWPAIVLSLIFLAPSVLGALFGFAVGAATLGSREDWWLRSWTFAGFVLTFQVLALLCAAFMDIRRD